MPGMSPVSIVVDRLHRHALGARAVLGRRRQEGPAKTSWRPTEKPQWKQSGADCYSRRLRRPLMESRRSRNANRSHRDAAESSRHARCAG